MAVDELRQRLKQLRAEKAAARVAPPSTAALVQSAQRELQEIEASVRAETMMATDAVRRVTKVEQSLEQGMQSAGSSGGNGSSPSSDTFTATVGASVIVRSMGVTATVIKIMSDGTAKVQAQTMQMSVKLKDLAPVPVDVKPSRKTANKKTTAGKRSHEEEPPQDLQPFDAMVQTEANTIDIRGERVEEALAMVEEAIDSCPLGMALAVVHGTGTGRLRAAVQQMLSRHRQVARTEEDQASRGGSTWVTLK